MGFGLFLLSEEVPKCPNFKKNAFKTINCYIRTLKFEVGMLCARSTYLKHLKLDR